MNMQRIEKEWFITGNLIMLEKFINFRAYLMLCDLYDLVGHKSLESAER